MIKSGFQKTLCALALAGACAGANATTTVLGSASVGVPLPFSGYAPVGSFIDDFTFSLPANGGSGYSVVNFPLSIPEVGSFNTIFSSLALFSDPDGTAWNGDEVLLTSSSSGGNSISLSWIPTSGGHMLLQVAGATNGSIGGIYSGAIGVSPIPEPGTLAMLMVGIALIGFSSIRKMH